MIDYEIETDSPDNDMWVVCLHTVYRDGYIYCTCSVCLSVHLSVSPLCKDGWMEMFSKCNSVVKKVLKI